MRLNEVCSCEAEFEVEAELPLDEVIALLTQWRDHHSRHCPDLPRQASPPGGRIMAGNLTTFGGFPSP